MEINKALETELDKLGIYELRNLARQLDVASPTTKKREQLLSCIKSRLSGEASPENKSRAGRPAKKMHGSDNLLSNFLTKTDNELNDRFSALNINPTQIIFRQDWGMDCLNTSTESINVYGVLRKTVEGSWFFLNNSIIRKKIYVIVQESYIKRYNLIEGDMVFGGAEMVPDKDVALLTFVDRINGDDPSEIQYDENQELELSNLSLNGYNVLQGQSLIRCLQGEAEFVKEISTNIKTLKKNGYRCVFLGLDMTVQKKLSIDQVEGIDKIFTMCGDAAMLSYEVVLDAIYHAKAMFLRRKKLVLFVLDIFSIYSLLDLYFSNKGSLLTMGHTLETIQTIKMLLGASQCAKQTSVNVVASCSLGEQQEYQKELKELGKIAAIQ